MECDGISNSSRCFGARSSLVAVRLNEPPVAQEGTVFNAGALRSNCQRSKATEHSGGRARRSSYLEAQRARAGEATCPQPGDAHMGANVP